MHNKDKTSQKSFQIKHNSEDTIHQHDTKDDFDEWKRLEKWRIGRKNFC